MEANGTNGHGTQQIRTPRRSMADITQLFMAGAKTSPTVAQPAVIPPPAPQPLKSKADLERELLGLPAEFKTLPARTPPAPADAVAANASYLIPSRPTPELIASLRRWAKARGASFGVISLDAHALRILQIDGRDKPAIAPAISIQPNGGLDMQLGRVLYEIRDAVSQWIIACPDEPGLSKRLLSLAHEHVLVCGFQDDGLIDAYRSLKSFNSDSEEIAGVRLLLEAPSQALAQRWHQRLNGVTKEFLHQELALEHFTAGPLADIGCVAMIPTADLPADQTAALGQAIEDFFRDAPEQSEESEQAAETADLPAEVIESLRAPVPEDPIHTIIAPEERAALEDNWPKIQPPPPTPLPAKAPAIAAAPVPAVPPSGDALHVYDVPAPQAKSDQWLALEQAIPQLHSGSVILEARPPWDHAALAVDTQKQLHAWIMASGSDPFEWPAIKAWADAHRDLIALTCRDLKLNTAKPVQAHVVLPLDTPSAAMQRAWPTDIKWYRLQKVQWQDRCGVAVVAL